jgi:hypothetical protein
MTLRLTTDVLPPLYETLLVIQNRYTRKHYAWKRISFIFNLYRNVSVSLLRL